MKLQDLDFKNPIEKTQKVFESYFNKNVDFSAIRPTQAKQLLSKVNRMISEHRASPRFHTSEKDPNYLKLMIMQEGLNAVIESDLADIAMKDPKVKATMAKASKGQNLNPDEQKTLAAIALTKTETKKQKKSNPMEKMLQDARLNESEVQQAQVVLAAQDMTDRIQDMLEDVTEMKFKDLPALVDSIRNEVGMNQAQQYSTDASTALDSLIACLQETKTSIESAQGVITGQEPVVPGEGEAELDLDEPEADMDVDVDAEVDADAEEPASDLEASLGRARR